MDRFFPLCESENCATKMATSRWAPSALLRSPRCPIMKKPIFFGLALFAVWQVCAAERFADRFVWIFGWGLEKDNDVTEISRVLETAGQHHFNGAVLSYSLDTLSNQSPHSFRRLDQIKKTFQTTPLDF